MRYCITNFLWYFQTTSVCFHHYLFKDKIMKKLTSISAYGFFIFLFFTIPVLLFVLYSGDYIKNHLLSGRFLVLLCITIPVIVYFFKFFPRIPIYRAIFEYQKNVEIISFISHEIRSPIHSSMLIVESVLEIPELSQSVYTNMMTLYRQLERMESIISRIFSIQRFHMGIFSLSCESVEMKSFLAQEVDLYRHLHKGVIFRLDCSFYDNLPLDKIQFRQVLSNLFENATKHITWKKKIVAITCKRVDDTCTLIIEDSWEWFHGIGTDKIFEKHTRGDYKTSGLGLGLYLCRQIIASHHGTIRALSSEKYWGAKFEITLPIKTSKN